VTLIETLSQWLGSIGYEKYKIITVLLRIGDRTVWRRNQSVHF
jgi:hypothetical protein